MRIETKFNLGDIVYHICCSRVWQDIPCPTCGESGKVTISGEEFVCPKCRIDIDDALRAEIDAAERALWDALFPRSAAASAGGGQ